MSAVTRSPEREPLLERHSESYDGRDDAVKVTALKTDGYAYSSMLLEGKVYVEYGAAEISVGDGNATVEFHVTENPSDEMSRLLKSPEYLPIPKTVEDFSSKRRIHSSAINYYQMDRVKKVTVNARLLTPPDVSPILGGISLLCRKAFPNMESSVVNLYRGEQEWRLNGLFSDPSEGILNVVAQEQISVFDQVLQDLD